jgi:hypothetical protein
MRKFVSLGESRPSQSSSNEELLAMDYELGYFDLETRAREVLENPFGPKVSPL